MDISRPDSSVYELALLFSLGQVEYLELLLRKMKLADYRSNK